jgi:hypothetical protein
MKRNSFAIGDKVRDRKSGRIGFITDINVNYESRSIDYGIDGAAWFQGSDIELLEDATDQSLEVVFDILNEEYGGE